MIGTGATVKDFRLPDLHRVVWSLDEILSKGPVLLAFFKVSCPVCQLTLPFLERMYSWTTSRPMLVWGVSQDDAATTAEFLRRFGLTFPCLLDTAESGYPVSNAFGITNVPSMFYVEPDQTISWASTGFSRNDLEELGHRLQITPFRADDQVPDVKAG